MMRYTFLSNENTYSEKKKYKKKKSTKRKTNLLKLFHLTFPVRVRVPSSTANRIHLIHLTVVSISLNCTINNFYVFLKLYRNNVIFLKNFFEKKKNEKTAPHFHNKIEIYWSGAEEKKMWFGCKTLFYMENFKDFFFDLVCQIIYSKAET